MDPFIREVRQVVDGGNEDVYFKKDLKSENSPFLEYQTVDLVEDMNPTAEKNTVDVIALKMGIGVKSTNEDD